MWRRVAPGREPSRTRPGCSAASSDGLSLAQTGPCSTLRIRADFVGSPQLPGSDPTSLLWRRKEAESFRCQATAYFPRERSVTRWRPEITDYDLSPVAVPMGPPTSRRGQPGVYKLLNTSRAFDAIPLQPTDCHSNR